MSVNTTPTRKSARDCTPSLNYTRGARSRRTPPTRRLLRSWPVRSAEINPKHPGALHVMGKWNYEVLRLSGLTDKAREQYEVEIGRAHV